MGREAKNSYMKSYITVSKVIMKGKYKFFLTMNIEELSFKYFEQSLKLIVIIGE